jgi:hypothetical protein
MGDKLLVRIRRLADLQKEYLNTDLVKSSHYDFLLRFGVECFVQECPELDPKYRQSKHSFSNAALLAIDRHDLIYCEGEAIYPHGDIELAHAWCIDQDGRVIDPTWNNQGLEYFGVPFDPAFLNQFVVKRGGNTIGMINDYASGYPLLNGKHAPSEFLHQKYRRS